VGNIDWNHPRSWEEVCRRHAARARWNAVRHVVAEDRRRQVLELVLALGGLQRGREHTDLGATPPELHPAGPENWGTNGGIRSLTRGSVS
jgi:hypothetical protein